MRDQPCARLKDGMAWLANLIASRQSDLESAEQNSPLKKPLE
jgi:hypothetical protein